jgi:hypothetical protein
MSYPNTVASLPGVMGTDWSYLVNPHRTAQGDVNTLFATVGFRTTYANHSNFFNQVFNATYTIPSTYGSITRVFRMQHPEYPTFYASAFRLELTGNASGSAVSQMFSDVKFSIDFSTVPYGIAGATPFSAWNIDQGSIYTTQPGRKFAFPSNEPLDQDAGQWAVLNSYTFTLYNCPIINDSAIDICAGCVNNAAFQGRPAGTLLFGGCRSSIQTNVGGAISYQMDLSFTYRSYPWNMAYKANGVLDFPLDPSGNPPYNTADFTTLFAF